MQRKYCCKKIIFTFSWFLIFIIQAKCNEEKCPLQYEDQDSDTHRASTSCQDIDSKNHDHLSKAHFSDFWGYRYDWTKWNRTNRMKMVNFDKSIKSVREKIPSFTKAGYKTQKTPIKVDRILQKTKITDGLEPIDCEGTLPFPLSNCAQDNDEEDGKSGGAKFLQLEFPTNQRIYFMDDVVLPLQPILEEWLGIPLNLDDVTMFGIRFLRGAWMSLFADAYPTHAFGIILQIGQKVDEKWPLNIVDHQSKKKKIYLKPGEMIMFEGSKVPRGRQFPLKGDYYDELVLFFQQKNNSARSEYYD